MKFILVLLTLVYFAKSEIVSIPAIGDNCELVWYDYDTNNLVPTKVTKKDVLYYLYTDTNPTNPVVITNGDVDQLKNTTFNPKNDILVVIHGWLGTYNTTLGQVVIPNVFSTKPKLNVLVVDWNALSRGLYAIAREAAPNVGRRVAEFIRAIQKQYDVTDDQIMLVGHSFGAQAAGNAGKALKGAPRYIIALDPALPLFTVGGNDTLKSTDAQYVQVIHSDDGLIGIGDPLGQADFYPNGGASQAGCSSDIHSLCDHMRAVYYYGESLLSSHIFLGTKCASYEKYLGNNCQNESTAVMGTLYPDTSAKGSYYLTTNPTSPYARD